MSQQRFRVGKCWQTANHEVVLQVMPLNPEIENAPKKLFLIANLTEQRFGVSFSREKPVSAESKAPFPSLTRKFLTGSILDSVTELMNGDISMSLWRTKEVEWKWRLRASHPPELQLIDPENIVFVRTGMRGSFTKRHISDAPESPSKRSLTDLWLQSIADETQPSETQDNESHLMPEQKHILKQLRRRLKTLRQTLNKTKSKIPHESDLRNYISLTDAFAQHVHSVPKGSKAYQFQLGDDSISIELDEKLTPGECLNLRYQRIKKMQRAIKLGTKHQQQIEFDIEQIQEVINEYSTDQRSLSEQELQNILLKHNLTGIKPTSSNSQNQKGSKFRKYKSVSNQLIYVGRNAENNDELTKSARGHDLWFHVAGMTGSHVIVPHAKPGTTEITERQAAILALHYSPLKKDFSGEVYRTHRRHLRKRKGLPPGLWIIDKSTTQFIKYTQEELNEILQSSIS